MKKRLQSSVGLFVLTLVIVAISQYFNLKLPPHLSSLSELLTIISASPTPHPGEVAGVSQPLATNSAEVAVITKVVDGDTVELSDGRRLRYIGIDTPESKKPNTPVQCFALKAAEKNKQLVEGQTVQLVKDVSETDRYGRLLRYVYVGDRLINEQLVSEGYAFARSYPPDIALQNQFKTAEAQARENNRGLWSECEVEKEHVVN